MFTLDGLRCFCAVARLGSFRAAAAVVHRSQPAVTQQVSALERALGQALLERRPLRLTTAGELVFARATAIIAAADALARESAELSESGPRELRVGTSDTTAMYLLPRYVSRFSQKERDIRLVLTHRSSDAIARGVLDGELDLGLVTLPVADDALVQQPLFQDKLRLVVHAAHPLAGARRVALARLAGERFLMLDPKTRTGAAIQAFMRDSGFQADTILDSGSFEVIKRYVVEGVGISFLPGRVVGREDPNLAALSVPGAPSMNIGAIWRRNAHLGRAHRAFMHMLTGKELGV